MDIQATAYGSEIPRYGRRAASTGHLLAIRMADPFLTDHDRWVLRQLAYFVAGVTPDPSRSWTSVGPRPLSVRPMRATRQTSMTERGRRG